MNPLSGIQVLVHESDTAEAAFTALEIAQALAKGGKPEDFAVLTRTNYIAERIAATLEAHRIPVRRKVRPQMPEDWRRAKAALRMIQAGTEDAVIRHERILTNEWQATLMARKFAAGTEKAAKYLQGLERTVVGMSRDLQRLCVSRESIERIEKIAAKLVEPTLADIVLAVNQDYEEEIETKGVFVGTLHSSKGNEWPTVFLAGFEDETIPGRKDADISEERRLAFVGMTRAETTLIISWAKARRSPWGQREWREMTPSRFLSEAGLQP